MTNSVNELKREWEKKCHIVALKSAKKTDFMICVAFSHRFLITAKRSCWLRGFACRTEKSSWNFMNIRRSHVLVCYFSTLFATTSWRIYYAFRISLLFFSRRSFFLSSLPIRSERYHRFNFESNERKHVHARTDTHGLCICLQHSKKKSNQRKNNSAETEREQKKSCTTFKLSKRE